MPSFSTIKREVMFKCILRLIFAKRIKEIFSRLKQKYEDLLKLYIHKEECYQESLKTIDELQKTN